MLLYVTVLLVDIRSKWRPSVCVPSRKRQPPAAVPSLPTLPASPLIDTRQRGPSQGHLGLLLVPEATGERERDSSNHPPSSPVQSLPGNQLAAITVAHTVIARRRHTESHRKQSTDSCTRMQHRKKQEAAAEHWL